MTHRRQLLATAWAVVRHQEAAEDAVHTAFVRLAQLRNPPRDPKLYAFKVVRNTAIDLLATRNRRRERPLESTIEPGAPAHDGQDTSLLGAVAQALGKLEPDDREVIEWHLHAELTFQEIGNLLGQPLSTVASRYRRALGKLRQQIEVLNG